VVGFVSARGLGVTRRLFGLPLRLALALRFGLALWVGLTLWLGLALEGRLGLGRPGRFGLSRRLGLARALVHPAILGLAARLPGGPPGTGAQRYGYEPAPQ
jgi:hypothetical protein